MGAAKLYIVVDATLKPASVAPQAVHAALAFAAAYPALETAWREASNTVVIAQASAEQLHRLVMAAGWADVAHAIFCEPDMGDWLTAVAFEPGERGRQLCGNLKLALCSE